MLVDPNFAVFSGFDPGNGCREIILAAVAKFQRILLLVFMANLAIPVFPVVAQQQKKLPVIAYASVGQSLFKCDPSGPEPSKFPAMDMRIGAGTSYRFNDYLEARTRLVFGLKRKRESVNTPGQPVVIGSPYFSLDETVVNDHYFWEVPLLLQFNLPHPQFGLRVGPSFRSFFPNNDNVDLLTARKELSMIGGIYYRLGKHLSIGLDYNSGMTVIYKTHILIDNTTFDMTVKNRAAMFTLEYSF